CPTSPIDTAPRRARRPTDQQETARCAPRPAESAPLDPRRSALRPEAKGAWGWGGLSALRLRAASRGRTRPTPRRNDRSFSWPSKQLAVSASAREPLREGKRLVLEEHLDFVLVDDARDDAVTEFGVAHEVSLFEDMADAVDAKVAHPFSSDGLL